MDNIKVVKIRNPENYNSWVKEYGILIDSMPNSAMINFDSNKGGICVTIAHEDYYILHPCEWNISKTGRVIVHGSFEDYLTDLIIWGEK